MSKTAHYPPQLNVVYRLLQDRDAFMGRTLSMPTSPVNLTRLILPGGSLFVLLDSIVNNIPPPKTSWGRQLGIEAKEAADVLADVLCDSHRCVVLLTPGVYELAE